MRACDVQGCTMSGVRHVSDHSRRAPERFWLCGEHAKLAESVTCKARGCSEKPVQYGLCARHRDKVYSSGSDEAHRVEPMSGPYLLKPDPRPPIEIPPLKQSPSLSSQSSQPMPKKEASVPKKNPLEAARIAARKRLKKRRSSALALVEKAGGSGLSTKELAKELGVSGPTALSDLRSLKDDGKAKLVGKTAAARWYAAGVEPTPKKKTPATKPQPQSAAPTLHVLQSNGKPDPEPTGPSEEKLEIMRGALEAHRKHIAKLEVDLLCLRSAAAALEIAVEGVR